MAISNFFLEKDRVEVKFLNKIKDSIKTANIELAICLVKNPMETILQKSTELGVKANNSNYFRAH